MTVKESNSNGSAPDVQESDVTDQVHDEAVAEGAEEDRIEADVGDEPTETNTARRLQLSFSIRSLLVAALIAVLIVAAGVLGWLYVGAQHRLDAQARQSENTSHAEKVALDYAVNAAAIDSADLKVWKGKLVAGTTPELNSKLTEAAQAMEQILVPLQWNSTAHPLAAKVRSETGGVYVVDSFVSVMTKTIQAPEPLQSTATYSITIDSNNNWQISDVGGIGDVVEQK
jgi:Mce-associated membrane protein